MLSVLTSMAAPLQGDGDAGILFGRQGSLSPIDTGFSFFLSYLFIYSYEGFKRPTRSGLAEVRLGVSFFAMGFGRTRLAGCDVGCRWEIGADGGSPVTRTMMAVLYAPPLPVVRESSRRERVFYRPRVYYYNWAMLCTCENRFIVFVDG